MMEPPPRALGTGHESMTAPFRTLLLLCLLVGVAGTTIDLLLIGHYEDPWQWTPILLLVLSALQIGWCLRGRGVRQLRWTMGLFLAAGFLGLWFHFTANLEFEREVSPSLQGADLVWKAIRGAAPPSLAPAAFMQLGFLGLLCSYGITERTVPLPRPAGGEQ
jgi:hypothetical protein